MSAPDKLWVDVDAAPMFAYLTPVVPHGYVSEARYREVLEALRDIAETGVVRDAVHMRDLHRLVAKAEGLL